LPFRNASSFISWTSLQYFTWNMNQPEGFVVKGKENLVSIGWIWLKAVTQVLELYTRCSFKSMGYVSSTHQCLIWSYHWSLCVIAADGKFEQLRRHCQRSLTWKISVLSRRASHPGPYSLDRTTNPLDLFSRSTVYMTPNLPKLQSISTRSCWNHQKGANLLTTTQSAVGSLRYLATRTCPDIAFAVGNVARYCCKPTKLHWTAVFRHLRGTTSLGLLYHEGELDVLYGYSEQIGEVIVMTTNLPQVNWRHCSNMEDL
jgi:hypothetical protein